MAAITINVPDGQLARIIDAVCASQGYQSTVTDPANPAGTIPNPQSKAQFARAVVAAYIRSIVQAHEADVAAAQSRATSDVQVT